MNQDELENELIILSGLMGIPLVTSNLNDKWEWEYGKNFYSQYDHVSYGKRSKNNGYIADGAYYFICKLGDAEIRYDTHDFNKLLKDIKAL